MKDIMKNDKVESMVNRIYDYAKFGSGDKKLADYVDELYEYIELIKAGEALKHDMQYQMTYGNGTGEPTTDIDEVRQEFNKYMGYNDWWFSGECDCSSCRERSKVWQFFLPYLKGGEWDKA